MQRLMLATDLSTRSHRALERSLRLAGEFGARLSIVHIVDEDLPDSIAEQHRRLAEQSLRDRVEALPSAASLDVAIHVVLGRVAREILRLAEEEQAELLVLGARREERFADLFRGTTPERVVRAGKLPVLVAAGKVQGPYRRVIIGVDFSIYSRRSIEYAAALLPEAQFFLVHAYEVPFAAFLHARETEAAVGEQHERQLTAMINEELSALERAHGATAPLFQRVMRLGRPAEVICAEVERLRPDLLVVGTHGRTGVPHAILGSVAENLLTDPPCDVLVVR